MIFTLLFHIATAYECLLANFKVCEILILKFWQKQNESFPNRNFPTRCFLQIPFTGQARFWKCYIDAGGGHQSKIIRSISWTVCDNVDSANNNKTSVGRDATTWKIRGEIRRFERSPSSGSRVSTSWRRAFARNVEFLPVFSGSCVSTNRKV